MAAPRRIQLTSLASEVTLPPVSNGHPTVQNLTTELDLAPSCPSAELETTTASASVRIELQLFEPDERRCPEFYYPELIKAKDKAESDLRTLKEVIEDKERDELKALARKFEEKYGGPPKRRKDRLQDLVDMGYGYDETDSFIDNSEAMRDTRPNNAELKAAIKATWASITPQQCHRLIASMPHNTAAVIHAKGALTKFIPYWGFIWCRNRRNTWCYSQHCCWNWHFNQSATPPPQYDELVPACLTTKHGGFYVNSGTLQFRQASEEGEENETDEFEVNLKPKKRKLKDGMDERMNNSNKKRRQEDLLTEGGNAKISALTSMQPGEKKKKKKNGKPQSIDGMLKRFHKEKIQQLQMFNGKGKEVISPAENGSTSRAETQEESVSADPLLTLIGSASADELLQAVKAVDQDFDLEGLLTEDQDSGTRDLEENQEATTVYQPARPPPPLPDGLPPMLELYIQELSQAIKDMEGENKMELFAPEINGVLLHVAVKSKELSDKLHSRVFSYLASQLSCKKGTLLKRAKKLHLLHLGDELRDLLMRLEEAVKKTMPEQIDRFNDNCQAHSEARAAKLEAEKEQRAVDGSDEEEEDKIGKRVFGPRKRFKWTEEIRELLSELVKLKMSCYELEAPSSPSLEEYLRNFLEDIVKPMWPKGWMQSRILLIESRRVHGHITGVVARKKSMAIPKSKKISLLSENTGEVLPVPVSKGLPVGAVAQRKRLSLPLSTQQAPQNTVSKPQLDSQTTVKYTPTLPELQQIREEVGRPSLGAHKVPTEAVTTDRKLEAAGKPFSSVSSVHMGTSGGPQPTDSSLLLSSSGVAVTLKRLPTGEKKPQKLMLVAPPAAAEGDSAAVQGVARLLTTTSFCTAPVSVAVAAVESSCGDPALPTPSLSLQASSYPSVPQSGALKNLVPLHALPFPGLAFASKKSGHAQMCKDAILTSSGPGSFQYGLTHGIYSALCSSVLYPLSGRVSSSPSSLHALSTRPCPLDESQLHAEGANSQRKLH